MTDETVGSSTATPAENGDAAQAVEKEVVTDVTDEGQEADADAAAKPAQELTEAQKLEKLQKKLAKAEFEKRATRREMRAIKEMADKLTSLQQSQGKPVASDKEPSLEDYQSLPEYIRAFNAWERSQTEKTQSNQQKAPQQDDGVDWGKVVQSSDYREARDDLFEAGSEKFSDFEDVVVSMDGRYMNPEVAITLFQIPDETLRADVTYYLGKNPKELQKFASLSPIQRAIEVGRIESKIHGKPASEKRPSNAPPPIKPVSGAETKSNKLTVKDSVEEHIKKRRSGLKFGQ